MKLEFLDEPTAVKFAPRIALLRVDSYLTAGRKVYSTW
jgi:hypothetical protein